MEASMQQTKEKGQGAPRRKNGAGFSRPAYLRPTGQGGQICAASARAISAPAGRTRKLYLYTAYVIFTTSVQGPGWAGLPQAASHAYLAFFRGKELFFRRVASQVAVLAAQKTGGPNARMVDIL
jgi:hypothetical protein